MTTGVFRNLDVVLGGVDRLGVVHVGAHRGQEVADYRRVGFDRIVLVEPNPWLWPDLDRLGVAEVHTCAAGTPGTVDLFVTEWDERSSVLRPVEYPVVEVVRVERRALGELQHGCNVAVIDVQGAELDVLGSARLELLDVVIVEVCDVRRYEGAATRDEIESAMIAAGWRLTHHVTAGHSAGIADQVWRSPTCSE